ncbi:hypothetical protein D3C78_1788420 [compost metagenome]
MKLFDHLLVNLIAASARSRADGGHPVGGIVILADAFGHLLQNAIQQAAPACMYRSNGATVFTAENHRQAVCG